MRRIRFMSLMPLALSQAFLCVREFRWGMEVSSMCPWWVAGAGKA